MFTNITWKQAVMEEVLSLVNSTGTPDFGLKHLYAHAMERLHRLFPRNHHVPDKVRQVLQYLRDDGLIMFVEPGQYRLDTSSPHLDTARPSVLRAGRERPPSRTSAVDVRLRDTVLGLTLKRLYRYRCQACGETVPLTRTDYAESHHLRPLGRPHEGPDTPGNVIILCPNHHVMFGRGAAAIHPETLDLLHSRPGIRLPKPRLIVRPPHVLAAAYVLYHYRHIFQQRAE